MACRAGGRGQSWRLIAGQVYRKPPAPPARGGRLPAVDTASITAELNPQQRDAVTAPDGNLLVLAGAGTGKTRVLTSRVAWLVANGMAHTGEVLAVTFTNKAAEEMRGRVRRMLGHDTSRMWIGTFHSIANRLLRMHATEAGIKPGFQIIDKSDQTTVARGILKDEGADSSAESVREMTGFISKSKEWGLLPSDIPPSDTRTRRWLPYFEIYNRLLREQNKVDFGDLMILSGRLLRTHPEIQRRYTDRFRHVLVDEFQDTSAFQYDWLKLFKGKDNRFFAVGDDDQSIYGFRSADPRIMSAYREEFEVGTIVRLELNYRSQPGILKAANALIDGNTNRIGKTLRPVVEEREPIHLRGFGADKDEAHFVAAAAAGLVSDGDDPGEIGVIYRTNAQSRLLEQAMLAQRVRHQIYGGRRFFDRKEVRDSVAYLRLAVNPQDHDALQRVVNFPPRGIGAVTVGSLAAHPGGMWAGIQAAAPGSNKVDAFRALVEGLAAAHSAGESPGDMVVRVNRESGLREHFSRKREDRERIENLDELVNAAREFEQEAGEEAGLADFVSHLSLDTGKSDAHVSRGVSLMTAHAAKGLEFGTVFVVGLEDGLFPHYMSLESPAELEEERRLLYVAITRAKRRLFLTYARTRMEHGNIRRCRMSRFVEELPDDVVEEYSPGTHPVGRPAGTEAPRKERGRAPLQDVGRRSGTKYEKGDRVEHPMFGQGIVMTKAVFGGLPVLDIRFDRHGKKRICPDVVEMKVLDRV